MEFVHLAKETLQLAPRACGLVLGNFDGVHRGHIALIDELKRRNAARSTPLLLGALCFRTPPSHTLGNPVPQLTTNQEKFELLRRAGLHFVLLYEFDELKDLSPEEFVKDILIAKHNCLLAVCGFNYTFGKRGAGTPQQLAEWLSAQQDAEVGIVPAVTDGRHTVSSTVIRSMLERGHPEDANRLLGHHFTLEGKVERGKRLGRVLGFPTANLRFPANSLVPAHGVYAVAVRLGRKHYRGIANVGIRPTFDNDDLANCEVHLLDYEGYLYGKTLRVSFLHFLRAERAFANADALQAQIQNDISAALEYF